MTGRFARLLRALFRPPLGRSTIVPMSEAAQRDAELLHQRRLQRAQEDSPS